MAKNPNLAATATSVRRQSWMPPLPPLPGEDQAQYDELFARVSKAFDPRDAIEEIWVTDFVDHSWEIFRLRRLRDAYIKGNTAAGLAEILQPYLQPPKARELAAKWQLGESPAMTAVSDFLALTKLSMDTAVAATLALKLTEIVQIERMIAAQETLRNGAGWAFDHRRVLAAERAAHDAIDRNLSNPKTIEHEAQSDQPTQN